MPEYAKQLPRKSLPPAFLIEEEEIGKIIMPRFAPNVALPFSLLMDINNHIHIEYNHAAYDPKFLKDSTSDKIKWFFKPNLFYERIAPRIIEGSLLSHQRSIVGGMSCHYYTETGEVYLQYWGVLTNKQRLQYNYEYRDARVGSRLVEVFDLFCRFIGAKYATAASGVRYITGEIIQKYQWDTQKNLTLTEKWNLFKATFPLSIRRMETPLIKYFN